MVNRRIAARDPVTVLVPASRKYGGPLRGCLLHISSRRPWRRLDAAAAGSPAPGRAVVSSVPSWTAAATILTRLPSIGISAPRAAAAGRPRRDAERPRAADTHLIAPSDGSPTGFARPIPTSVHTLPPPSTGRVPDHAAAWQAGHLPGRWTSAGVGSTCSWRPGRWPVRRSPGCWCWPGRAPMRRAAVARAPVVDPHRVRFIGPTAPGDRYGRLAGARIVAMPSRVDPSRPCRSPGPGTPVVAFRAAAAAGPVPPGCGYGCGRPTSRLGHRARPHLPGARDPARWRAGPIRRCTAELETLPATPSVPLPRLARRADAPPGRFRSLRPTRDDLGTVRRGPGPGVGSRGADGILATVSGPRRSRFAGSAADRQRPVHRRADLQPDRRPSGDGQWPNQFGIPFFLHPPASFLINATVVRILGLHGAEMDLSSTCAGSTRFSGR